MLHKTAIAERSPCPSRRVMQTIMGCDSAAFLYMIFHRFKVVTVRVYIQLYSPFTQPQNKYGTIIERKKQEKKTNKSVIHSILTIFA